MRLSRPEFQLNAGASGRSPTDRLFAALDQDGDGHISAEERASGIARLTTRDLDDDEMVSQQELAAQPYPTLNFGSSDDGYDGEAGEASVRKARFVTIQSPIERQEVAERWIRDYGKDGRLRVAPDSPVAAKVGELVGSEPAAFGLLMLDAAALVEVLKDPPSDMELIVRLGAKSDKDRPRVAFVTSDGAELPKEAHGLKFSSKDGSRAFETATERVELVAAAQNGGDNKEQYKETFRQIDQDNNKYIDKKESENYGNFATSFAIIDENGDEKIFEEEFEAWVARQLASAASRAMLGVSDYGRPFFSSFDTNQDGRLGLRELRTGLSGLIARDANGDQRLSEDELVHLYRLSVGPAQVELFSLSGVFFSLSADSGQHAKATKGPEWFRNMDRNQDGDVSRREFLGTAAAFKSFDRNNDGLIGPKEAAATPK